MAASHTVNGPMRIELLADHAELIPTLAAWFHAQWPQASTRHDPAAQFERACLRGRIPLTLVALESRRPIGTASLLVQSVASHRHLAPWLAALYVCPEARHRGVATRLIAAIAGRARSLGFETIYVGIDRGRPFYEGLGWAFVGDGLADDDPVLVLSKDVRG